MNHESFQIEEKDRTTDSQDMLTTRAGANANDGTWFIGGILAACGFTLATKIPVLSSTLSYIFLSLVGYIGYRTGLSTMTTTRVNFGERGSYLPSLINIIQFVGWTTANTFIAAQSVNLLLKDLLNMHNGTLGLTIGIIVMSILHVLSIASDSRSIQSIKCIDVILIFIFVIWESIVVFKAASLNQIISWKVLSSSEMVLRSAIDYITAFNLAQVAAGADFTRFTKKRSNSTIAPFWGALTDVIWFTVTGLTSTISITITSGVYNANNSDPSAVVSKLGLGTATLLVITLTSIAANVVNLLAAGSVLSNISPKIGLKHSLWVIVGAATLVTFIPMSAGSSLEIFKNLLDYVGMVLDPTITIICIDYYFIKKRNYEILQFDKTFGTYWCKSGISWKVIIVFILGIIIFLAGKNIQLLSNTIGTILLDMIICSLPYWILMKE